MSHRIDTVGNYIVIRNSNQYRDIATIDSISLDLTTSDSSHYRVFFRYSINSVSYSDWIVYTLPIINSTLPTDYNTKFYLDFKIELIATGWVEFNSLTIATTPMDVLSPTIPNDVYHIMESESNYQPYPDFSYNLDIYNQSEGVELHKRLSYISNNLLGHQVSYFKADPLIESRDALLKEWGLMHYRDAQYLKVVVPGNEFPDPNMSISPFAGFSFETPFEVHIDKRYFEQIFGIGARPQSDDAIFFDRTDRMYLIQDSELERSFMNEVIYHKVNLMKFESKSYISMSDDMEDIIDNATIEIEELLGKEIAEDQLDVTNKKQLEPKGSPWDMIRVYEPEKYNTIIGEYDLCNYDVVVSQYYYNLNLAYQRDGRSNFIQYALNDQLTSSNNRTFTSWLHMKETKHNSKDIKTVVVSDLEVTINFKYGVPYLSVGDWVNVVDSETSFETRLIVDSITDTKTVKKIVAHFESQDYKDTITTATPDWADIITLSASREVYHNLLNNYDYKNNEGMSLDILNTNKVRLRLNETLYDLELDDELQYNQWYGVIVNILNEFDQFSIYVYKINEANSNELTLYTYKTMTLSITETITGLDMMYIQPSSMVMTNIRWLNQNIKTDYHSIFLNQSIVTDSSKCMIIDNAEPRSTLPYVGNIK